MKKFASIALGIFAAFVVCSCQDDVITPERSVVRDYQTDSQVLSKFVDFSRSTGEYYINENKRTGVVSYLTDKDWLELQRVNPVNYDRYEKDLRELNNQLSEYAKDPNISKIVYSTYNGDTYVRDLNNDCSIQIEKSNIPSRATRSRYSQMSISGGGTSYASFNAGSTISTNIQILTSGYYLCELKCNTKGAQCTSNNSSGLVLSGTGPAGSVSYTWTSGSSSTFWDFTGKGKISSFGQIAQVYFED